MFPEYLEEAAGMLVEISNVVRAAYNSRDLILPFHETTGSCLLFGPGAGNWVSLYRARPWREFRDYRLGEKLA